MGFSREPILPACGRSALPQLPLQEAEEDVEDPRLDSFVLLAYTILADPSVTRGGHSAFMSVREEVVRLSAGRICLFKHLDV